MGEQRFSAALEMCPAAASAAEVPRGVKPQRGTTAVCRAEGLLHPITECEPLYLDELEIQRNDEDT
jgi:hypothetical protein